MILIRCGFSRPCCRTASIAERPALVEEAAMFERTVKVRYPNSFVKGTWASLTIDVGDTRVEEVLTQAKLLRPTRTAPVVL